MALFGKPTLQRRISLLVLAFLTLVLVLFGWVGIQSLNESTQRTLDERLTQARVVAGYLDQELGQITENVQINARFGGGLPTDAQFTQASANLNSMVVSLDITEQAVLLLGQDGSALKVDPPAPEVAGLARSALGPYLPSDGPRISPSVYDPIARAQVVYASAPVLDTLGKPIGALVLAINVKESGISNLIKPITLGQTGYAEIVDANGAVLARTQPAVADPQEIADNPVKFSMLISNNAATVTTCHRCHGTLQAPERTSYDMLAFAPLGSAPWGVAIRQTESEAFAIREQLKRRLLLLGGVVVIGSFLLVWVVTQGVVRPVRALTAAAKRVAEGDFKASVPVRGKDEIGQLGASFATMTRQLDKARNDLVSRNRELASINAIAATVGQSLDVDEVLARALTAVVEVTGTAGGCVALVNENGGLRIASRTGKADLFDCFPGAGPQSCACWDAMRLGRTTLVDEVSQCRSLGIGAHDTVASTGFVCVPLRSKQHQLGVMNLCFVRNHVFTEQDFRLLDAIGSYIGLAVENATLYGAAKEKEVLRGQLLDATISGQEEERKRLARELHDEFGQTLTGLIMAIESTESSAPEGSPLVDKLRRARTLTARALEDLRGLIRGLRSSVLDDLGLVAAIRSHAEERLEPAGIALSFRAEGMGARLPVPVETALFRIAQESINNVLRHSKASSVSIALKGVEGKIVMTIDDDGAGFDAGAFFARRSGTSLGIIGMRERATMLGGGFAVFSEPGKGTHIIVEVPFRERKQDPGQREAEEAVHG